MGGAKRLMEEREAAYQTGLDICIEAGAIEECENHPGSYYEGGEDVDAAYKLVNSKITRGEYGDPGKVNRREMTDWIKSAFEDNRGIDSCAQCDKNMSD